MEKDLNIAREIIRKARFIAVLTGAGISAESGVPTFRDPDGIWARFSASELATPEAFAENPRRVWEWYGMRRREMSKAEPNSGHHAFAQLEIRVPRFLLITQNIDNLHFRAGNRHIAEIHGNIFRNRCQRCGNIEMDERHNFAEPNPLPICAECGSPARVDVVWFGEPLPERELSLAIQAARTCDVFISAGTSAKVYPAAHFPEMAVERGAKLIEVNLEPTHLSPMAEVSLIGKTGEILPSLVSE